jgi:hypothetical protein
MQPREPGVSHDQLKRMVRAIDWSARVAVADPLDIDQSFMKR